MPHGPSVRQLAVEWLLRVWMVRLAVPMSFAEFCRLAASHVRHTAHAFGVWRHADVSMPWCAVCMCCWRLQPISPRVQITPLGWHFRSPICGPVLMALPCTENAASIRHDVTMRAEGPRAGGHRLGRGSVRAGGGPRRKAAARGGPARGRASEKQSCSAHEQQQRRQRHSVAPSVSLLRLRYLTRLLLPLPVLCGEVLPPRGLAAGALYM